MTTIIGICGPAGSGKSTVAERLESHYGARRYAFADPLKEMLMRTFDFTYEQMYGSQQDKETVDPRYGHSPRWFMQRVGTQGIRHTFGEDVWWKMTLDRIKADEPALAVIEDVRFVNESIGIHRAFETRVRITGTMDEYRDVQHHGLVWRLEPPGFVATADPTHASETQWSLCKYDYKLTPQYRGLDHLYDCIDALAHECFLKRVC